jgi:hypothetical protein
MPPTTLIETQSAERLLGVYFDFMANDPRCSALRKGVLDEWMSLILLLSALMWNGPSGARHELLGNDPRRRGPGIDLIHPELSSFSAQRST